MRGEIQKQFSARQTIRANHNLHLDKLEQVFYINGIALFYMFGGPSSSSS